MTMPVYSDVTEGRYSLKFRRFSEAPSDDLMEMFIQRKKTFVDKLKWTDLPTAGACIEVDEFDNTHAVYGFGYDLERLVLTARFLPFHQCMVRKVWPLYVPHLARLNAVEVSRLCTHDGAEPKSAGRIMRLYYEAVQLGTKSVFAIADGLILRAYKQAMNVPPRFVDERPEYPGTKLVQWPHYPSPFGRTPNDF